jgi:hypothetical protein
MKRLLYSALLTLTTSICAITTNAHANVYSDTESEYNIESRKFEVGYSYYMQGKVTVRLDSRQMKVMYNYYSANTSNPVSYDRLALSIERDAANQTPGTGSPCNKITTTTWPDGTTETIAEPVACP